MSANAARLAGILRRCGPTSARVLRRRLDVTPGELLALLREAGAHRVDRGGRVLWGAP